MKPSCNLTSTSPSYRIPLVLSIWYLLLHIILSFFNLDHCIPLLFIQEHIHVSDLSTATHRVRRYVQCHDKEKKEKKEKWRYPFRWTVCYMGSIISDAVANRMFRTLTVGLVFAISAFSFSPEDAGKVISDHVGSFQSGLGGGSLCNSYSCCNVSSSESCGLSSMPKDETTLVLPGGDTRCIYSYST